MAEKSDDKVEIVDEAALRRREASYFPQVLPSENPVEFSEKYFEPVAGQKGSGFAEMQRDLVLSFLSPEDREKLTKINHILRLIESARYSTGKTDLLEVDYRFFIGKYLTLVNTSRALDGETAKLAKTQMIRSSGEQKIYRGSISPPEEARGKGWLERWSPL